LNTNSQLAFSLNRSIPLHSTALHCTPLHSFDRHAQALLTADELQLQSSSSRPATLLSAHLFLGHIPLRHGSRNLARLDDG
jgi:hypothetical protein